MYIHHLRVLEHGSQLLHDKHTIYIAMTQVCLQGPWKAQASSPQCLETCIMLEYISKR